MSEPNFSKEEYIRAFRERLYASEAFHQTLAMIVAKERLVQDLQWEAQSRRQSRSLLKRLSSQMTAWLRGQQSKHNANHKKTEEQPETPPWTIDAFYVVADNGTISEIPAESPTKE
jgi:hypothetical protein